MTAFSWLLLSLRNLLPLWAMVPPRTAMCNAEHLGATDYLQSDVR